MKKIVLAYSGGLDTSIILRWLQENYKAEIIAYTSNIGQDMDERKIIRNAKRLGVKKIIIENKVIADCLEALIGGIYLDKGLNFTEKFILNLWSEHIIASVVTQVDAKTKLQEYSLKTFKVLPNYKLISNTGPRHKPLFEVSVKLKNTKFFTAQGKSKKDAEQNAASLCFESVFKK